METSWNKFLGPFCCVLANRRLSEITSYFSKNLVFHWKRCILPELSYFNRKASCFKISYLGRFFYQHAGPSIDFGIIPVAFLGYSTHYFYPPRYLVVSSDGDGAQRSFLYFLLKIVEVRKLWAQRCPVWGEFSIRERDQYVQIDEKSITFSYQIYSPPHPKTL